jgi:hypothetical protein
MLLLLPGECIGLLACASGAPSIEAVVTIKAIAREARRETIILNLHLFWQAECSTCLPLPQEVDRNTAAIQRNDRIVLIARHD